MIRAEVPRPNRTELPWLILGRHVAPLGFAVSLACLVEFYYSMVVGNTAGTVLDDRGWQGILVGSGALVAAVLLYVGYWARRPPLTRAGLLIAAGVFTARAFALWVGLPTSGTTRQSAWYSMAWVIATGGAYLLEVHGDDPVDAELRRARWRGRR